MDNDPKHTSHSTRRFIILNNINHFKTKYFLIVGRGIMELKLFLMFFIEGRRGPCRGRRGRTGAVGAVQGPLGPLGAVKGPSGAVKGPSGAVKGPSGAIRGH